MRRIAIPVLSLVLIAGSLSAETRVLSSTRYVTNDDMTGSVRMPARLAELHARDANLRTEPTVCPDSIDALHYELRVDVDHGGGTLTGDAYVTFRSMKDNLAAIQLDLRAFTVSGVYRDGIPLTYSHLGDTLSITLDSPLADGDTAVVRVVYSGIPWNEGANGFGGFFIYTYPVTDFSMGVGVNSDQPSMGRTWFPCVDSPCDKATCDVYSLTSTAKKAISNGELVSVVEDTIAGTKLWHWRENHQIATYLMSLSIARYREVLDPYHSFIIHYVHPDVEAAAPGTFANVHHMMDCYESLFRPYPWDKFGFVTTPIGDMEHQTCVSHHHGLMPGHTGWDNLLSHEMSHMWFGDLITYGDWRDVWLSEGFATYCEALFHEYMYGMEDYHDYVESSFMQPYLNNAENLTYPIYDPDYLWGTISYEKGATVLHMLRRIMGDTVFFASMNSFLDTHEFGNVFTPDFIAVCEAEYGGDMSWFFDEWIYQGGHPIVDWGWSAEEIIPDSFRVEISTHQIQEIGPEYYTMPVDFLIETASGDTTVTGWIDAVSNDLTFYVDDTPTAVTFDPDNWILDENQQISTGVEETAPTARFALKPNRPNPFNPVTSIQFSLPVRERVTLRVYSVQGELVCTLLEEEPLPEGEHFVLWDGRDNDDQSVASGVYLYRLQAGEKVQSRKMHLVR